MWLFGSVLALLVGAFHRGRFGIKITAVKPASIVLIGGIVTLIYVAVVLAVYVSYLGQLPISTSDPAPWGQLGDYVGGLLNPFIALMNVAVVAYIALGIQRLKEAERRREERSEERIRTTIELHREWNTESTFRSRTLAGKLVREYPESTMLEIEGTVPAERAVHVWIVVGFFQRLYFLIEHEKLDRAMTVELFGELFVWWWIVAFEKQIVTCDWDASERMQRLRDWFYSNTSELQRAPWERRAQRDREEAVKESKIPPIMAL